jgi:hypothetical protein
MLRLGVKNGDSIFFLKKGRVIGEIVLSNLHHGGSMLLDFYKEPDEDGVTILRSNVLLQKKDGPRLIAEFREGYGI